MNCATVTRLPLRLRTLVHERAVDDVFPAVRCPRQQRTIDAVKCVGCERMRTIEWDPRSGGSVECRSDPPPALPGHESERADLRESGARLPLHEVMSCVTVCVNPSATVRHVRGLLLARELHSVPIVDTALRLVGIVSRSDLMSCVLDHRVDTIMPATVHALPEDAPITYAIALMAFERIHEVPVVTDTGTLVGLVTANDVLRWTARRLGYVAPLART